MDKNTYNILMSYKKETDRREENKQGVSLVILGHILYVLILITCFTIFLTLFRKDYFDNYRSVLMLYSLILIFVVVASLMVSHNVLHVYLVPFAMVPIFR